MKIFTCIAAVLFPLSVFSQIPIEDSTAFENFVSQIMEAKDQCTECCPIQYWYNRGADSVLTTGEFDVDHVNGYIWFNYYDNHPTPQNEVSELKNLNRGGVIKVYCHTTVNTFGVFKVIPGTAFAASGGTVIGYQIKIPPVTQFNMNQSDIYCVEFYPYDSTVGLLTPELADSSFITYAGIDQIRDVTGLHPCDTLATTGFKAQGTQSYGTMSTAKDKVELMCQTGATASSYVNVTPGYASIYHNDTTSYSSSRYWLGRIQESATDHIYSHVSDGISNAELTTDPFSHEVYISNYPHEGGSRITDSTATTHVSDFATSEINYVKMIPGEYEHYLSNGIYDTYNYSTPNYSSLTTSHLAGYTSSTMYVNSFITPYAVMQVVDGTTGETTGVECWKDDVRLITPDVSTFTAPFGFLRLNNTNGSVDFAQAANVPHAAGTVTVADFNALIDSLIAAGLMAP